MRLPAGNSSEWTGPTGNNTWLLAGAEPALVDAGVGDPAHVDAVARALDGAPLARVLITHGHPDHAGGIPTLRARWPDLLVVPPPHEGEVPAGDGTLRVIPTPGHAPDHVCFFDESSGDVYCGDLARLGGTIVIPARQGGSLRAYLHSLRAIRELRPRRLLPGHGPIVDDPIALIDTYLAHRQEREDQVLDAWTSGLRTDADIAARIYPALSGRLVQAATDTVAAHLQKLREEGRLPDQAG